MPEKIESKNIIGYNSLVSCSGQGSEMRGFSLPEKRTLTSPHSCCRNIQLVVW